MTMWTPRIIATKNLSTELNVSHVPQNANSILVKS